MSSEADDVLTHIKYCVVAKQYRVRSHAMRHMIEEGFDENHLLETLTGKLQLLEEYEDENRCLVLGRFHFSSSARSPLHVVCDISHPEVVDIVTAYIPQRPWWISPTRRGKL
ncbi:MAG TPA: DUF4258 domain-containing protein [Abditibacteriaceae bacterium]|jgi:hypothetical protein